MFVGVVSHAQTTDTTGKRRMNRMEMYKDLNLTKDQEVKVKDIMEKQRAEMDTVRNNTSLTREQQREQMGTIRKKYNEQIEALLTPEQKEKLKAKQKEMQEEMQRRRNGQGGGNN
jgi:Spy/CpxP family protein refolding chaperone